MRCILETFDSEFRSGPRVQFECVGRSRTKQAERDACDINKIMAKYVKTGLVSHLNRHGGDYGFATSVSFHEAMNVVTKADSMFADLPAEVRRRFSGEPGEFLDFVQDESNHEEMIKLGLANRKLVPDSDPVESEVAAPAAPIPPVEPAASPEV